jgi:hypothetical protein
VSKEFDEENNIFNGNDISFMKKPQDIKVMIWGYELCNGAEWKDFLDVVNKLGKEKANLEAKLAEKEKEIEKWKTDYENCSKLEKLMSKERQYCLDNWIASDQDKISFAVEQLEKVKEWVKKRFEEISCIYEEDAADYIDNQIEELKKEMK